jgi:hypothetical protein
MPLEMFPLPIVFAPSLKVTEPVAVDGDTVAVSVMLCPKADGVTEEVNTVVVVTCVTT